MPRNLLFKSFFEEFNFFVREKFWEGSRREIVDLFLEQFISGIFFLNLIEFFYNSKDFNLGVGKFIICLGEFYERLSAEQFTLSSLVGYLIFDFQLRIALFFF